MLETLLVLLIVLAVSYAGRVMGSLLEDSSQTGASPCLPTTPSPDGPPWLSRLSHAWVTDDLMDMTIESPESLHSSKHTLRSLQGHERREICLELGFLVRCQARHT